MNPLRRRRAERAARFAAHVPSERVAAIEGREWDLLLDGIVQGRLIPEVSAFMRGGPRTHDWIFWHITWNDGSTNFPGLEDYGPDWPTLEEVEAGFLIEDVVVRCTPGRWFGVRHERREQRFDLREVAREHHHGSIDHDAQAKAMRRAPWQPDAE